MYLLLVVLSWLGGLLIPRSAELRPAFARAGRAPRRNTPGEPIRCEWHPYLGWKLLGCSAPKRSDPDWWWNALFNRALELPSHSPPDSHR